MVHPNILFLSLYLAYYCIEGVPFSIDDEFYDEYEDGLESEFGFNDDVPDHPDYKDVPNSEYAHLCKHDGNNPNPADCNAYFVCVDGEVKRVQACPRGTQFSSKEQRCITKTNLKEEEICKTKKISTYESLFEEHLYKLSDEDLEEAKEFNPDPLCAHSDGSNANSDALTSKERCTKYVECREGRLLPIRHECPSGLTYDSEYRTCVFPKQNTNPECKAMDTDTKRLKSFCFKRLLEGKFVRGTATLFRSIRYPCSTFIICIRNSDHKFGTCPPDKSFHPIKKQCMKHHLVPKCEYRGYA